MRLIILVFIVLLMTYSCSIKGCTQTGFTTPRALTTHVKNCPARLNSLAQVSEERKKKRRRVEVEAEAESQRIAEASAASLAAVSYSSPRSHPFSHLSLIRTSRQMMLMFHSTVLLRRMHSLKPNLSLNIPPRDVSSGSNGYHRS